MMRKLFVVITILSTQLFVSNCAYYHAQRDDVNSQITKWITEQEFDKANETLSQVKTTHPQFLTLMLHKKDINAKLDSFVATTIKQADFFIKENKWEDAYTVYNFALKRVANNKKLNTSFDNYIQKRNIYVNNLKYKIYINNAVRLLKNIPVQRSIALALIESTSEQKKFKNLQNQAILTIELLTQCTANSLKRNKIIQADKCLQFAIKLGPTDEALVQLKKYQRKIRQLMAGAKKQKQRVESNIKSRTLKEYKAAFEKNDLLTATKKLNSLLAENKNNYELQKLKIELDEAISIKVKAGTEKGRILYSKGNIKFALDKWIKLQKLDPENIELKSHISRAERVLQKLHSLTNKDDKSKANGS